MITNIATIVFLIILQGVQLAIYSKIEPGVVFRGKDQLVSTLGIFKAVLNSQNCSFSFHLFDKQQKSYKLMNQSYSSQTNGSCSSLSIINNTKLISQQRKIFLQLKSSEIVESYLIIDDSGVLRFIGLKKDRFNMGVLDYEQVKWGNFGQLNNYITILDYYSRIDDKFKTLSNRNNWFFLISNQQLTITNFASNQAATYELPELYFHINGVYDQLNQSFNHYPQTSLNLQTLCNHSKSMLYGPFVIEIDEYYPIFTVYDQDKYPVIQFSMINQEDQLNPCPPFTFRLSSTCLNQCPAPYIHQLNGRMGQCVLNCQYGSQFIEKERYCSCPNRIKWTPQQYKCANSSSSLFGCYCQNNTFLNEATRSCSQSCPGQLQPFNGRCYECPQKCLKCAFNVNQLVVISCSTCRSGYVLSKQGECIELSNCTSNCRLCNNNVCISCSPFFILHNSQCVDTCPSGTRLLLQSNYTHICTNNQALVSNVLCRSGCLLCSALFSSDCIICYPGYTLFVTSRESTCKHQNLLFSCQSKLYSYLPHYDVCYSTDTTSNNVLSLCRNQIANCNLCYYSNANICLVCNKGFYLRQNRCVKKCGFSHTQVNQGCVRNPNNCQVITFASNAIRFKLNIETINKNKQYFHYIHNGRSPINEPHGHQLYLRSNLYFNRDVVQVESRVYEIRLSCVQCSPGFGLSQDGVCLPCPKGCLLCAENNNASCLANSKSQVSEYLINSQSFCQGFLSESRDCIKSCPMNTVPKLTTDSQKLICSSQVSQAEKSNFLKIDGSSYNIKDNEYIHKFIFSSNVKLKTGRLLQQSLAIDQSGNSITIYSNHSTELLDLGNYVQRISTQDNTFPVNTLYGINAQTSFKSYIKKWLAAIGYVLSIMFIALHWIYIANNILYKMDNLIIFAQSIYFFLFTNVLIANPIAQYYYGWSWLHLNFYPNYFQSVLNFSSNTQTPYALYNIDANMVRNAGSSISFILTFFIVWLVCSLVLYVLDTYFGRKQLWYAKISKNSLIAAFEFVSYNIFYWCVAYLHYDLAYTKQGNYAGSTVFVLCVILLYVGFRCYTNLIGGIYMIKRIIYASVISCSYQNVGYVGIIIVLELVFAFARMLIEKPKEKSKIFILWMQEGFIILAFIVLYTSLNASVTSILVTIFVYGWFLTFVSDLVDLYFLSKNKGMDLKCFRQLFQEKSDRESEQEEIKQNQQFDDKVKSDRPLNSHIIRIHEVN